MTSNKEQGKKGFLISTRRKTRASITAAPFWAQQKAGKRLWNKRQKRHWRTTNLGKKFKKKRSQEGRSYTKGSSIK